MKSCIESALIVNIKTSAAIEQMIQDSKRKHFKNNIRQHFIFSQQALYPHQSTFLIYRTIDRQKNTKHQDIYQTYLC